MTNLIQSMAVAGAITPPKWLAANTHYLVTMGSRAYGVARPDKSDHDLYGFAVPPKRMVFPFSDLTGAIYGFGTKPQTFDQFEQQGAAHDGAEYDFRVMSLVKYFHLTLGCNPDVLDSLFVPEDCVLHCTTMAQMVRDNRHLFLHRKGVWHAFRGYAKSQLHKLHSKKATGKRAEDVQREGFDRKFAYHGVRLLAEAEQLLTTGTLDLRKPQDLLLAIREDDGMPLEDILTWTEAKQNELEQAYESSQLPEKPDEEKVLRLLWDCLEQHFGKLEGLKPDTDLALATLRKIQSTLDSSGLFV